MTIEDHTPRKSPQFALYANSFLAGCICLTNESVGMYIRLLCWQWENGYVPASETAQCRILGGISREELRRGWSEIQDKFVEVNGQLQNPRLELEREKQMAFRERQSRSGKRGAASRWGSPKPSKSNGSAIATVIPIVTITPEEIKDLWNATMTPPISKVKILTDKRRAKLRLRIQEVPDLRVWTKLFEYLNTQDWCNAPGHGSHPGWTADLDWIIRSEDTLCKQVEKMDTPMVAATGIVPVHKVTPTGRLAKIQAGNVAFLADTE